MLSTSLFIQIKTTIRAGGVAQVVEKLTNAKPNKCKALSSNLSTTKKRKYLISEWILSK
jgi:hypothetical protein